MKVVYVISAYKYPGQLIRLIDRLNGPAAAFFVHVDQRTDDCVYREMVDGTRALPNVCFLARHQCHWGDFGHVMASLKGMDAAIKTINDFDYIFLLTGQDYPIKSNTYIDGFLGKNRGMQFMEYFPIPYSMKEERGGLERIETWSFRLFDQLWRIPMARSSNSNIKAYCWRMAMSLVPKRRFPRNFRPFGGSGYWCITKGCAKYISDFVAANPGFLRFFKYTYVPDEIFFQSIILNSPWRHTVICDSLRCIDWSSKGIGDSYPRVWGRNDISTLSGSSALIARKFDATIDSEILDLIDLNLLSRSDYCRARA
jgi:hypothetical protein